MGKRSRKRMAEGEASDGGATRAQRDEARRRRAKVDSEQARSAPKRPGRPTLDDRPPAPWGNFPLVELCVLLGIALIVIGVIVWGSQGQTMLLAGFALCSLAGLELSIREHLAGYRSHTSILAGALAVVTMTALFLGTGGGQTGYYAALIGGVAVFGGCFWLLRALFKNRSGGLGFR